MSYIFLLHMERYFTFARRTVVRQPLFFSNYERLFLLEYLLTNRLGHEARFGLDISSLNPFRNKQVFSHCSSPHLETKTEERS